MNTFHNAFRFLSFVDLKTICQQVQVLRWGMSSVRWVQAWAWRWPPTSSWRRCRSRVELYLYLPSVAAWHVTGQLYLLLVGTSKYWYFTKIRIYLKCVAHFQTAFTHCVHCTRDCVSSRGGLDALQKGNIMHCHRKPNPEPSAIQP